MLNSGEIKKLEDSGFNIHSLKEDIVGNKNISRYDLFKDKQGNLYLKPKGGIGEGEPLNININQLNN
jgi:hypothetical protein